MFATSLGSARTAIAAEAVVRELERWLTNQPPATINTQMREFLVTRADASLWKAFAVRADGFLSDAPTLRVWLLDYWERIDPVAAADFARELLQERISADEWAVALRLLARGTPGGAHGLVRERTRELIGHEPWRSNPSIGFLEAFDGVVYSRDVDFVPELMALLRRTNSQALAYAAFLTMDRLVIAEPAATLSLLLRQPELGAGREATRANWFARANVSDPRQRSLIESYLVQETIGEPELRLFASAFPNANFALSHNLLTSSQALGAETVRQRDRAALDSINAWLANPRFARSHALLSQTRDRLERFVGKSGG